MKKTLTVFTPTYNRAYCLHLLYESLCRQTSADFDWLIIDDGSSDNTKELVAKWISEEKISIQYVYKENGGMHTGHNAAFAIMKTELSVCIDSDDYMPDNGVEIIIKLWNDHGSDNYGGMIGLDVFSTNGNVVGNSFPKDKLECKYSELKPKYGVWGDKKIVFRTAATTDVEPYPEFEGERFVPLLMAVIVDQKYDFLCFNEVFCIVEYQEDGSTINIFNQYFRHPKGFSYSRKIEMVYYPTLWLRFKSAVHYVFTSIISRNGNFLKESPKKLLTILAIPFGVAAYLYLSFRKNKKRDIRKYVE